MGYLIEEAKDHLNTIEQGLLSLQTTIEDPELVNEVFRAAHSVKGGAAMLGLTSVQQTAHRLEDSFKILKECKVRVDQHLESLFLRVFDTLQALLEQLSGPFGLPEDVAETMLRDVEPVFEELNNHLDALVKGNSPVAVGQKTGKAKVLATAEAAPAASKKRSATKGSEEESALQLIFRSDVPARMRAMLQLFKQPESIESRQQLAEICHDLKRAGEQFELRPWEQFIRAVNAAITHSDNRYRTLAPIVIKEIKQAQELVVTGRSVEITVSPELAALAPPELDTTEHDLADLLAFTEDGTGDNDLADLLTFTPEDGILDDGFEQPANDLFFDLPLSSSPEQETVMASDGLDEMLAMAENSVTADGQEANPAQRRDRGDGEASYSQTFLQFDEGSSYGMGESGMSDLETPHFRGANRVGPEVGQAELNTLADLFEGESPELDEAWEEEETLEEPVNRVQTAGVFPTEDDTSGDFTDLLFDAETPPESADNDDLASLFGKDFMLSDEEREDGFTSQRVSEPVTQYQTADADPLGLLEVTEFTEESLWPEGNDLNDLFEEVAPATTPTASDDLTNLFGEFTDADLQDLATLSDDEQDLADLLAEAPASEEANQGSALALESSFASGSDFAPVADFSTTVDDEPDFSDLLAASHVTEDSHESVVSRSPVSVPRNPEHEGPSGRAEHEQTPVPLSDMTPELDLDSALDGNWLEEALSLDGDGLDTTPELALEDADLDALFGEMMPEAEAEETEANGSSASAPTDELADLFDLDELEDSSTASAEPTTDWLNLDEAEAGTGDLDLGDLEVDGDGDLASWFAENTSEPNSTSKTTLAQDLSDLEALSDDSTSLEPSDDLDFQLLEEETTVGDASQLLEDLFDTAEVAALDENLEVHLNRDVPLLEIPEALLDTEAGELSLDLSESLLEGDVDLLGEQDSAQQVAPETVDNFDDLLDSLDAEPLLSGAGSQQSESVAVESWTENDDASIPAESEDFADLEAMLDDSSTSIAASPDDFSDLDNLLAETPTPAPVSAAPVVAAVVATGDEFGDLEQLLDDIKGPGARTADTGLGQPAAGGTRRPSRRVSLGDQTMRVPVKQLDNLSNLMGELVVNRNSLEQDQERMRQFLDNLLHQVSLLSDVGQRMQDLYERSLLEISLLASRQNHRDRWRAEETPPSDHSSNRLGLSDLELDRFTPFHGLSQEIIELIVRVRESAADIEFLVDEADQVTRQLRQITTQLQEGLTRARMMPFSHTTDRLPRAVRDISIKCGKQAQLVVEGKDILIDKMLLEQLYDPMTHLVNNAISHGIETPDVRQAAGKPAVGKITIRAFHQGNQTVISVGDDGAGIDPQKVKAKALKQGLITAAQAQKMSRTEVYDLLFMPGFSTAEQATEYYGRGVGMDVVRTSLSEIRGTISTDSTLGKGTIFTIRLPLILSISKALCCISDRARIAFPMDGVEDMIDVPREQVQTGADGQPCIEWRGTLLPFRHLRELLTYNRHLGRGSVYGFNTEDDMISVIVLRSAGNFLAVQVDQVSTEQEIVIKQLEGPVPKPVGIAGATVLGDGRIVAIADVLELIDLATGRLRKDAGGTLWDESAQGPVETTAETTEPTVLIVDDSITVRSLLSITFEKAGYRVEEARDGKEAWEKLKSGLPCDIVFCDIEMPRMDGLELLSRMQKDATLCDLPIAMLTSRGADRHRQMAYSLGARGYFTKPYLEEQLLDAAGRMLKGEIVGAPAPTATA